jgi:uncharacterized protein YecE (DUF72 family)
MGVIKFSEIFKNLQKNISFLENLGAILCQFPRGKKKKKEAGEGTHNG